MDAGGEATRVFLHSRAVVDFGDGVRLWMRCWEALD
jgi:hypothetical protein